MRTTTSTTKVPLCISFEVELDVPCINEVEKEWNPDGVEVHMIHNYDRDDIREAVRQYLEEHGIPMNNSTDFEEV